MDTDELVRKILPLEYKVERVSLAAEIVTDPAMLPPNQLHIINREDPRERVVAVIYHYNWKQVWVEKIADFDEDLSAALVKAGFTIHEGEPQEYKDYLLRVGYKK